MNTNTNTNTNNNNLANYQLWKDIYNQQSFGNKLAKELVETTKKSKNTASVLGKIKDNLHDRQSIDAKLHTLDKISNMINTINNNYMKKAGRDTYLSASNLSKYVINKKDYDEAIINEIKKLFDTDELSVKIINKVNETIKNLGVTIIDLTGKLSYDIALLEKYLQKSFNDDDIALNEQSFPVSHICKFSNNNDHDKQSDIYDDYMHRLVRKYINFDASKLDSIPSKITQKAGSLEGSSTFEFVESYEQIVSNVLSTTIMINNLHNYIQTYNRLNMTKYDYDLFLRQSFENYPLCKYEYECFDLSLVNYYIHAINLYDNNKNNTNHDTVIKKILDMLNKMKTKLNDKFHFFDNDNIIKTNPKYYAMFVYFSTNIIDVYMKNRIEKITMFDISQQFDYDKHFIAKSTTDYDKNTLFISDKINQDYQHDLFVHYLHSIPNVIFSTICIHTRTLHWIKLPPKVDNKNSTTITTVAIVAVNQKPILQIYDYQFDISYDKKSDSFKTTIKDKPIKLITQDKLNDDNEQKYKKRVQNNTFQNITRESISSSSDNILFFDCVKQCMSTICDYMQKEHTQEYVLECDVTFESDSKKYENAYIYHKMPKSVKETSGKLLFPNIKQKEMNSQQKETYEKSYYHYLNKYYENYNKIYFT